MTVAAKSEALLRTVRILPQTVPLPDDLRQALASRSVCGSSQCTLFWRPGAAEAIAVGFGCPQCVVNVTRLFRDPREGWVSGGIEGPVAASLNAAVDPKAQQRALAAGRVEIREVTRRQVFLDGKPVAGTF